MLAGPIFDGAAHSSVTRWMDFRGLTGLLQRGFAILAARQLGGGVERLFNFLVFG
jgi:hypothetical protein